MSDNNQLPAEPRGAPTRRLFLHGSLAAATLSLADLCGASSPGEAAPKAERIEHERWTKAEHGYLMIAAGVLAPGMIERGVDDEITFRWWQHMLLPEKVFEDRRDYPLRGLVGVAVKERIRIGSPVIPPLYHYDAPVFNPVDVGTRVGYAHVRLRHFFPWRWIQIELDRLNPPSRGKLTNLEESLQEIAPLKPEPRVFEIWTPPHEVSFLKQLFAEMWENREGDEPAVDDEDADKGIGPPVSVGLSLDFDHEPL